MPTYEYRCTECARHIEVHQSFTDAPKQQCEFCGGKLRRIFSPVGVMFKGAGFYSTDARSDARASARKSEGQSNNGEQRPEKAKADAGANGSKGESKSASGEAKPSGGNSSAPAKRPAADKKT